MKSDDAKVLIMIVVSLKLDYSMDFTRQQKISFLILRAGVHGEGWRVRRPSFLEHSCKIIIIFGFT